MKCDIVIRSYYKDFEWLSYCLASIARHAGGFRRVILVVPQKSLARLDYLGIEADEIHVSENHRDDYLGQQITKLTADLHTDADSICHLDSDCAFHGSLSPHDLMDGGKPVMVMTPYRLLPRQNPWKGITQDFLGWPVGFDFMRRMPVLYPRWIYGELRRFASERHGVSLESYVLSRPHRGFSEFNALGGFAFERHRESFSWVDSSREPVRELPCKVFWSWGGIDDRTRRELLDCVGEHRARRA